MSSLANQLAARTTLDSSRLATANALKNPPSFIYTPRHAASISTADLHSIASNAWDQLSTLDPFFEKYHDQILGEEAKGTDRSSLTKEENVKLGNVLNKVMRALGRHMLLKPAGVVLEWLVRRFRYVAVHFRWCNFFSSSSFQGQRSQRWRAYRTLLALPHHFTLPFGTQPDLRACSHQLALRCAHSRSQITSAATSRCTHCTLASFLISRHRSTVPRLYSPASPRLPPS